MRELVEAFRSLRTAPRGLWLVVWAYSVDMMAYYAILTLMTTFLHEDLGVGDGAASVVVSVFTGAVTLFMFGAGPRAERLGVRRGIALALVLVALGRALYSASPHVGAAPLAVAALALTAVGEGVLQPVAYAGVKAFTDARSSAMGYAMLYAVMNLAGVLMGIASPLVRVPVEARHKALETSVSGVGAVGWLSVAVTAVALVVFMVGLTPRAEAAALRPLQREGASAARAPGTGPLRDPRFVFFIFMLLPVRTLFAHQWLTMPAYVLRAFPQGVADRMEWLLDLNPLVIFLAVPTLTALTRRAHVYTMMIVGSLVSALPTFLLCLGPSLPLLVTYFVVFSIGEALWSARFLEYAAELAPEGRVAEYMAVANVPWLLAKATTGLYSGAMLARFCPESGPKDTETLWLVYGLVAMASPVGLLLGRRWVMGSHASAARPAGAEA